MSNTFILPANGKSLALSRVDWNEFLRSTLSHSYGEAIPTSGDFTDETEVISPYTGLLHRNSKFNALYIYDSSRAKGGGLGGGFTRQGIGFRNFEGIIPLVSNLAFIEQAEILTTVGDSTANYRVYIKTNNSNSIVDIGISPASSLLSAQFVDRQIANTRLLTNSITAYEIAPYTITQDKLANSVPLGGANVGSNVGSGTAAIYAGLSGAALTFKTASISNQNDAGSSVDYLALTDTGNTLTFVLYRGTAVGVGVGK